MTVEYKTAEQVVELLRDCLEERLLGVRISEWSEGATQQKSHQIWARIDKRSLRAAIRRVMDIQFPHFAVISGVDVGDAVELLYHMYVFYGMRHKELLITFTVSLGKDDLRVDTITDLIPGALISEREKQEMLGVEVVNIPDGRRMFLPTDFPEGVHPWRKDDKGIPEDMVKQLWRTGRPAEATAEAPQGDSQETKS